MINLFDAARADEVKSRIARVSAGSKRAWGKMTPAQALAHCSIALESALGDRKVKRLLIGRVIGGFIKPKALGDDAPMRRNTPTAPEFVVHDEPELAAQRQRLTTLVDRFAKAGPSGCTKEPHAFFGRLTPDEWAVLMYKHVDHHLRQFGA